MSEATQLFSSRLNILCVENEERTGKTSGKKYQHFVARCIVLDDKGEAMTVGTLRSDQVVPEVRDSITAGTKGIFRAVYGLRVPDYGDQKGDVVAMVTALQPEAAMRQPTPKVAA